MRFDVKSNIGGDMKSLEIKQIGAHNVKNALAAVTVASLLDISDDEISAGLLAFSPVKLRQSIVSAKGFTVIEDCYNAGPESMRAAIEVLAKLADKNHCHSIAVLGDMRELGDYSKQLHMEIGTLVASRHIDYLVTFGREAEIIALGAINHAFKPDNISINTNTEAPAAAAKVIFELAKHGDAVLFKASRAVRLERVIEEFKKLLDTKQPG